MSTSTTTSNSAENKAIAQAEQDFLKDLENTLWQSADKLRNNLDAAVYKHAVLGLIFLKYVSDAFEERRSELKGQFTDSEHEYFLDVKDYDSTAEFNEAISEELEERDYYIEKNVFWVPELARWQTLQDNAKLSNGSTIKLKDSSYTMRSTGKLIDDALDAVEKDNPKLKGVLNKTYTSLQLPQDKLAELIDLIATIPFNHDSLKSKDILGHVYEYFLGQFAMNEGKKGGQYYTPKSIVTLIVEMLRPFEGRVYDPAMGSGGFFISSEKFIDRHEGNIDNLSIYGQESNPTTWKLAAMNMAIRGLDFNFGKIPADSFTQDQHPDLRADYVMANPPFNISDWWSASLEGDVRWKYGIPPKGNANYGWIQHMLHHLAPKGKMALLLANGSMSTSTSGEGDIRQSLIEADLIDCMVALPGQLFANTQIPACIWFLSKEKAQRKGEVLFIDARNIGYMKDRVLRDFTVEDIIGVAATYHAWQDGEGFEDIAGYCKSATLEEIQKHDFVLTPGRYVGAAEVEDDGEPFAEKMTRLTAELKEQFEQSAVLEKQIKENLVGLGYEF